MSNSVDSFTNQESQEWLAALESLLEREGAGRAKEILDQVLSKASDAGVGVSGQLRTGYSNSINAAQQADYPGDLAIEARIEAINRWNAIAMVMRATRKTGGLGGHIASYNSIATAYEVGLNHFFQGREGDSLGDFVYFQGHSSEGNYARAYLEGRMDSENLDLFRQEAFNKKGLSSYPHPWLMPDFWQFATVSLGLAQMQGSYAARFLKYIQGRGLAQTDDRRVWVFCGDGEMDEPESRASLCMAANEGLDNLTYIINCNLQRLDGLVRSHFKVVDEMESLFKGCGWHVIKMCWDSQWDTLFAKDTNGLLQAALNELIDGDLQTFTAHGGAYFRKNFFGKSSELTALVADMSDEDLEQLGRAGHDPLKVNAAYQEAKDHKGGPSVVLLMGVKGYGLGDACESQNVAHNTIELTLDERKAFRDRFKLPLDDKQLENLEYYHPGEDSEEVAYLKARRQELKGFLPARFSDSEKLEVPGMKSFEKMTQGSGDREMSTTMALGRIISTLLKDKKIGERIVPIFSDEARTFGMEGLFRQVGIYSHLGQLYEPEDKKQLAYYKETTSGQVLMEGITEAGCMSSWIAAGTSYSTNNLPMIPMFVYYSMFGFQREGDLIWAAGDMRTRGFLFGATAGRTSLRGEGLQHQDGNSLLTASSVPSCVAYDPAYAYELSVVVQNGLERMYDKQEDVFFYVMVMNEKYVQPAMPEGVEEGILKGMYLLRDSNYVSKKEITLFGSGAILNEVMAAAEMLEKDFDVKASVWSITSYNELVRNADDCARHNLLQPEAKVRQSYLANCLTKINGPIVAATDYIRAYADQIRSHVSHSYRVLGTDGYGRSDTTAALRQHFEVDSNHIAFYAVVSLIEKGDLSKDAFAKAVKKYNIDVEKINPLNA